MKIQKKIYSRFPESVRFKMKHSIVWTLQHERNACKYFGKINLLYGYHLICILDTCNYLIQPFIPYHIIMSCSSYLCWSLVHLSKLRTYSFHKWPKIALNAIFYKNLLTRGKLEKSRFLYTGFYCIFTPIKRLHYSTGGFLRGPQTFLQCLKRDFHIFCIVCFEAKGRAWRVDDDVRTSQE